VDTVLGLISDPKFLLGGGTKTGLAVAFVAAAALVVIAGTKLSAYGDALAKRTGLASGLVGLLFLAAVTSLPELVVSTTAAIAASLEALKMGFLELASPEVTERCSVVLAGGADLAIGNMVGSNVFNLMLIAVMDLVQGKGALMHRLSRNHVMAAASGLGMVGLLMFGFAICGSGWGGTALIIPWLCVGPVTLLLPVAYLFAVVLQHRMENRDNGTDGSEVEAEAPASAPLMAMSGMRFYGTIGLLAVCIVVSGVWLSMLGGRIALPADQGGFGLGQTFVGTFLLAVSTSLPELVVSIAAVRMGCFNMAFGNVLGSNMFNLVVVFAADVGLRGASILHFASPAHLVTIAMVTMLTCVVLVGLCYRSTRSIAWLGIEVWVMVSVYALGNAALFWLG
jgi:cation:H+ antiporter